MPLFLDAPVTLMLLITIVMVSGYAIFSRPDLVTALAVRPHAIRQGRDRYRAVTGWLVHAGMAHLAFNLFTLWSFGRGLEAILGSASFAAVFLGSELAAVAMTVWRKGGDPNYSAVGASGAISGLLFAYCLYRPNDLIYLFAALPIPAWAFAIAFVGISIYAMKQPGKGPGIAHEAHLGGAIGGVLVALALNPGALSIFLGQMGLG